MIPLTLGILDKSLQAWKFQRLFRRIFDCGDLSWGKASRRKSWGCNRRWGFMIEEAGVFIDQWEFEKTIYRKCSDKATCTDSSIVLWKTTREGPFEDNNNVAFLKGWITGTMVCWRLQGEHKKIQRWELQRAQRSHEHKTNTVLDQQVALYQWVDPFVNSGYIWPILHIMVLSHC